jgi:hypothetical protein
VILICEDSMGVSREFLSAVRARILA